MNKIAVAAIAGAALIVGACGAAPESAAPESTVTETAPAPEPEVVTETETAEPEPTEDVSTDSDVNAAAMQYAWDAQSTTDQDNMCLYFELDEAGAVDAYMIGSGDYFTRAEITTFFNGVCP